MVSPTIPHRHSDRVRMQAVGFPMTEGVDALLSAAIATAKILQLRSPAPNVSVLESPSPPMMLTMALKCPFRCPPINHTSGFACTSYRNSSADNSLFEACAKSQTRVWLTDSSIGSPCPIGTGIESVFDTEGLANRRNFAVCKTCIGGISTGTVRCCCRVETPSASREIARVF